MSEYPSQSHASREQHITRNVEQVVTGEVRQRSMPWGRRVRDEFIQGSARSMWSTMLWDVMVPGIRDNVADAIHEGIERLFNGSASHYSRRYSSPGRSSGISKHNPDRALGGRSERLSREERTNQEVGVLEIDSRVQAEEVLTRMNQVIDQFDVCTLAEYYQMMGETAQAVDYKFGWEELGGSSVQRSRTGFYLDLPKPIPIR